MITGLAMGVLCFLMSLATRRFLSGAALVGVTTSLALLIILLGLGTGMAASDFRLIQLVPYILLALAIGAAWYLGLKARVRLP
jgi:hypothetical protein